MTNQSETRAVIAGTGLHAPERRVTNAFFNEMYGKDVADFLVRKRNIHERRHMAASEATSDLIVPAARDALAMAGITERDLDLIIVATDTPDQPSPATAAVVQHKLGARSCGTFDVNSACAGFVTALDIGSKFIRSDRAYRHILVAGAYGMSKFLDYEDYKVATLFGDGAGAVVLRATREPEGVLASQLYTDGQYHDHMGVYAGGTLEPLSEEVLRGKRHLLSFAKRIPNETNPTHWPRLTHLLMDRIGRRPETVSRYFLTQINVEAIDETMRRLELPLDRAHRIMDRYGYTGSASIPMALADAVKSKLLKKGDLLMLIGSGGGLSMAALALTWGFDT